VAVSSQSESGLQACERGGRADMMPSALAKKYELNLPDYPDQDQVVELPSA
jgi:hypothetical protein